MTRWDLFSRTLARYGIAICIVMCVAVPLVSVLLGSP